MAPRKTLLRRIITGGAITALAFQLGTHAAHAKPVQAKGGQKPAAHQIDPSKPVKLELELSQRELLKFHRESAVYNPNKKGQCAGYARRIAEKYFGKKYKGANAWDFAKANRVTFRRNFVGVSEASGISKGEMLSLIRKGIISPGTIIGAHYPESFLQKLHPEREFTHVLVFVGFAGKKRTPIFWDVWDKDNKPRKISLEQIYSGKIKDRVIYPLTVIEPGK
ncbi:MAG: hypothetical protein WC308_03995 [archaeon]|jgi:hypothetical protein